MESKTLLKESSITFDCEFCGNVYYKKSAFKTHLLHDHENTMIRHISHLKSNLLAKIEEIRQSEREKQKRHYCKGFCIIDHSRFRYLKSKSQAFMATLNEINERYCNNYEENEKETTFQNPSL